MSSKNVEDEEKHTVVPSKIIAAEKNDEEHSHSGLSSISIDDLEYVDYENQEKSDCPGELFNDQNTFFDVLDYVEEPYDENEDDPLSEEDIPHANTEANEESTIDYDNDQFYETIEGEITDEYEKCSVVDVPEDLNEKCPLPEGWKSVYHESGVLLYWHPRTNVCSLSRPYFIGTGSTKMHKLPETSIPCLNYRDRSSEANLQSENVEDSQKMISDYCKRLFKLKTIKYLKFRSWDVRRNYLRTLRNERNRRKLHLTNKKFISFPIVKKDEEGKVVSNRKWIITPRGRSYVAILHEYLQQSLKTHPIYTFKEVDNAKTPYAATVIVNGDEYGTGVGMSKKDAKLEAAKATLLVLLPKMKKDILSTEQKYGKKENCSEDSELNVASIFDDIAITDPRITQLSKRTTEPTPYELLLKCLQKKNDKSEVNFSFKMESAECTMSVGEHTVTVRCDNKREGKQLAAQSLLKVLHPYIENWGSLLRLYGNQTDNQYQFGSCTISEDKDMEEIQHSSPNKRLLSKLRNRMLRLQQEK